VKNKFLNRSITATLAVFLCTANFAYAISIPAGIKQSASKILLAMLGIVLCSILLYVGLSLYNRFFVAEQIKNYKLNRDSLRTPKDKDEAILTFITKNRLK